MRSLSLKKRVGDLLIVLGSVMDSFFKLSLDDSEFDNINGINIIRNKERTDINDYREIFEAYYKLSDKKIYVRSLDLFIQPFKDWKEGKSSLWWQNYQGVKHNRFINKEKATLETLLLGAGGLFLLIAIHLPSRLVLRRLDHIKTYWNKYSGHFLEQLLAKKEPVGEQSTSLEIFSIETKIFGYVYESLNPESRDENVQKRLLALLKEPKF